MTKPFYLTSEFYVTLGTILAAAAGAFPVGGHTASIIVAVSAAAYAVSRGLAKSGGKATGTHPLDAIPAGPPPIEPDHIDTAATPGA